MLGSLMLYLKGMRRMMFQLAGFYYICPVEGVLVRLQHRLSASSSTG